MIRLVVGGDSRSYSVRVTSLSASAGRDVLRLVGSVLHDDRVLHHSTSGGRCRLHDCVVDRLRDRLLQRHDDGVSAVVIRVAAAGFILGCGRSISYLSCGRLGRVEGTGMDFFDEVPREPRRVTSDETIIGTHQGSVGVSPGVRLTVRGTIQGSVSVASDAAVVVPGTIQGSVSVSPGAVVEVSGSIQGSVHIDRGGLVRVLPSGSLRGSLYVDGAVDNQGARGGTVAGAGTIDDQPGSRVVQPSVVDGVHIYQW
jgi:hypothetical protein